MAHEFAEFHAELRSVAGDLLAKDRAVDWPVLVDAGWVGLEVPERSRRSRCDVRRNGGRLRGDGPRGQRQQLSGQRRAGRRRPERAAAQRYSRPAADRCRVRRTSGWPSRSNRSTSCPTPRAPTGCWWSPPMPTASPVVVDAGLTVTPQPVVDETRRLGDRVTPTGSRPSEALRFDGDPEAQVRRLLDRAAVAIACDSLGLSEAMLSATVVLREGAPPVRPPHRLVPGRQTRLRRHAGERSRCPANSSAPQSTPSPRTDPTPVWRPRWRSRTPAAPAVDIAGKAMQLHGGIGYTWESGIHVYLKRAALNRSLFGSPAAHRKQLAQRYL